LSTAAERLPSALSPNAPIAAGGRDVAVQLDGVTKRFGKTTALDGITLNVHRGELMTLLGPSGCGKTTLLNLIAGFLEPDQGEIVIDGQEITDLPTHRREIGIMFQSYALFPHMSVAANVGYGLKMRGLGSSEMTRRVAEALALVKLAGLEDRRPRQLSGGQQQRVALARAIVIRPRVLLLDEPFSALDRNLRASMQVEIKEIQRKLGVTTIFVTHDQSEALSLSDRIAVMVEGNIRQLGKPEEIYRYPADRFVASFVGDVNVLRCHIERIERDVATVTLGSVSIMVPAQTLHGSSTGDTADLFVRPEELRIVEPGGAVAIGGTIAAQVYRGDHIDLHVDVPEAQAGRILIRVPGHDALSRWPVGTRIGIALAGNAVTVFARHSTI
jgi:spermidine/putrescine ABC transporter ATP-binding subunit